MISMDKKYRDGSGVKRRILCIDSGHKYYPVVAINPDGGIMTYTSEGHVIRDTPNSACNLIEIQTVRKLKPLHVLLSEANYYDLNLLRGVLKIDGVDYNADIVPDAWYTIKEMEVPVETK